MMPNTPNNTPTSVFSHNREATISFLNIESNITSEDCSDFERNIQLNNVREYLLKHSVFGRSIYTHGDIALDHSNNDNAVLTALRNNILYNDNLYQTIIEEPIYSSDDEAPSRSLSYHSFGNSTLDHSINDSGLLSMFRNIMPNNSQQTTTDEAEVELSGATISEI